MFLEEKAHFLGNKTVDQPSGANLKKNCFFAKICCKFLAFFKVFCSKNIENDYFEQRLECAAPKRWSKYTTANWLSSNYLINMFNCLIEYTPQ